MDDQISSPTSEVDRISSLPDDIIIIILSNLFVEESARTSILSKRWHKLWLLSPLIISDESIVKNSCTYSNLIQEETSYSAWIINTLYHILNTHPGPIRACHFILPIWEENDQAIVQFLRAVVRKGIQKLQIEFFTVGEHNPPTKLVIKDVPNLECFNSYELPTSCKVVLLNAPKLKVLDFTSMKLLMLQLGNCRFSYYEECLKISGEITYMPSLQYLDIIVDFNRGYEVNSIPYILVSFPCLETLIVETMVVVDAENDVVSDDDNDDDDDDDDMIGFVADDIVYPRWVSINCFSHHLKHVRLEYFSGRQSHLDFANFIVTEARVLQTMTLVCSRRTNFEENEIETQRQLLMHNRASKILRVEFIKD